MTMLKFLTMLVMFLTLMSKSETNGGQNLAHSPNLDPRDASAFKDVDHVDHVEHVELTILTMLKMLTMLTI